MNLFNLKSATYQSVIRANARGPIWSLNRTIDGNSELIYDSIPTFTGTQDTARTIDGFLMLHQVVSDSGLVPDAGGPTNKTKSRQSAWKYEPAGSEWFTTPDTTVISGTQVKLIAQGKQFQSRSLGMSWPAKNTFRDIPSLVKANGSQFVPGTGVNAPMLRGGPLRRIQFKFGDAFKSRAYRYVPTDTTYRLQPCKDGRCSFQCLYG